MADAKNTEFVISYFYWARYSKRCVMQKPLQLENMSTSEKLTIINDIWSSLIQEADSVPSPNWHQDVLQARVDKGIAKFTPLDAVKKELRSKFE